jgi:hypothetical protein
MGSPLIDVDEQASDRSGRFEPDGGETIDPRTTDAGTFEYVNEPDPPTHPMAAFDDRLGRLDATTDPTTDADAEGDCLEAKPGDWPYVAEGPGIRTALNRTGMFVLELLFLLSWAAILYASLSVLWGAL